MKQRDICASALIISLIISGMFVVYGLGEENKPPEIKVKRQEEASVSSPLGLSEKQDQDNEKTQDRDNEETQDQDNEKTQDREDKKIIKGGDNGVFKLGGNEIKLMLVQPQPLFSTELFSESEKEDKW